MDRFLLALGVFSILGLIGCGPDMSTTTSAPPPQMTETELEAQRKHYAPVDDRSREAEARAAAKEATK